MRYFYKLVNALLIIRWLIKLLVHLAKQKKDKR